MNKNIRLDGKLATNFGFDDLARMQRAFSYGDGLFETIAVVDGRAHLLSLHLDRLRSGCARLAIALDEMMLRKEIDDLLANAQEGVLRIVVARADFERGYRSHAHAGSHRLLQFFPQLIKRDFSASPDAILHLCRQRLGRQPALAGMKHLNRLEQVLARREWNDPAITEGLMLDTQERVIEAVTSNIFIVAKGQILTPCLDQCGVAGVMRRVVMEFLSVNVSEVALTLDDLYAAEEIFITNATRGIQPVTQIGCAHWARGSVTIALQNELQQFLSNN